MRAYRKRTAENRNVTITDSDSAETIAALRKQVSRLQRLLSKAHEGSEKEQKQTISFPIETEGGRWLKIKSTTELRPGVVIRLIDSETADVILAKEGRVLTLQNLQDGCIGDLSIYDAKDRWKRNTRVLRGDLVRHWISNGKPRRFVANLEEEAKVGELSKQVQALKQPNYFERIEFADEPKPSKKKNVVSSPKPCSRVSLFPFLKQTANTIKGTLFFSFTQFVNRLQHRAIKPSQKRIITPSVLRQDHVFLLM